MINKIKDFGLSVDNSIRSNLTKLFIKSNLGRKQWIHSVFLRWHQGENTWCFDIPFAGIIDEPFVDGIPELIEFHLNRKGKLKEAKKTGICVLFSGTTKKPDCFKNGIYAKLQRREEDNGGCWYWDAAAKAHGWLCPNLYQFFARPPRQVHFCIR